MTIVIESVPNDNHEGEIDFRVYLDGEEQGMNYGFAFTREEALTRFLEKNIGRLILANPTAFGFVIKQIPEVK